MSLRQKLPCVRPVCLQPKILSEYVPSLSQAHVHHPHSIPEVGLDVLLEELLHTGNVFSCGCGGAKLTKPLYHPLKSHIFRDLPWIMLEEMGAKGLSQFRHFCELSNFIVTHLIWVLSNAESLWKLLLWEILGGILYLKTRNILLVKMSRMGSP